MKANLLALTVVVLLCFLLWFAWARTRHTGKAVLQPFDADPTWHRDWQEEKGEEKGDADISPFDSVKCPCPVFWAGRGVLPLSQQPVPVPCYSREGTKSE